MNIKLGILTWFELVLMTTYKMDKKNVLFALNRSNVNSRDSYNEVNKYFS